MANRAGKAYGMTAFTPMTRKGTYGLLRTLFFRGVAEWLKPRVWQKGALHRLLVKKTAAGADLRKLSFIHFARWVVIRRDEWPPQPKGKPPREDLEHDYLLFESNFNGSWEQYIDAFSRIVPGGMDKIWKWSVKYPKSKPITPFLQYIRGCQLDTDYYYSAYSGAAINDVVNAIGVDKALEDLAREASDLSADEFLPRYELFLRKVGSHLGSTGPHPAVPAPEVARRASEREAAVASRLTADAAEEGDRMQRAASGNGGSGNGGSAPAVSKEPASESSPSGESPGGAS